MIGKSNVTRIKIVTVSHDVARLGMGEALANIRMDFYVCVNGDLPESSVVKTVMRSGPKSSTLWHQPRGEELQTAFRMARDNDRKGHSGLRVALCRIAWAVLQATERFSQDGGVHLS